MAGKRRTDSRGRVLKTGETIRKRGTKKYQYAYTDRSGKRYYLYAETLDELRALEEQVLRDKLDGIDRSAGDMTVYDLVSRHYNLIVHHLKPHTVNSYGPVMRRIQKEPFGSMQIKKVTQVEAKEFYNKLHYEYGLKRNTIEGYHALLRPAFAMAVESDWIRKNPFNFYIAKLFADDSKKRKPLSRQKQEEFLAFMEEFGPRYYNDVVILIETGMRVSELYGLTMRDVDMVNKTIHVRKQLYRLNATYYLDPPKSNSGVRDIPMSPKCCEAFQRVLENRRKPKIEYIVNGCSGFLFLTTIGTPRVAENLEGYISHRLASYREKHGGQGLDITPHVFRHTFCTDLLRDGLDIKSLQYLMGHSRADSITLDVYSHADADSAREQYEKVRSAV